MWMHCLPGTVMPEIPGVKVGVKGGSVDKISARMTATPV